MPAYPRWIALVAVGVCLASAHAAEPIVGHWKTIDDKTGEPRGVIEIYEVDGRFHGAIRELFDLAEDEPEPVCENCPGEKKGRKLRGLEIIWGLEDRGDRYEGGRVLDPETGNIYRCRIQRAGENLKVRGFIGISIFGRTQTWLPAG